MTRNEMKAEQLNRVPIGMETEVIYDLGNVLQIVDEFYDDLDKRTCENCQHLRYPKDITYEGYGKCMLGHAKEMFTLLVGDMYIEHMIIDENFGCNDFKEKE